ncbi:MAG: MBL fold metallo-hydrolase [Patescibacteria group bacterium]|nr:MBL fold metallo-hydrolase [Patescibacteria group bacterium]MBU2509021.1 MBL fold metallo-hydrolase [Patescibacteria group bacterium]
MSLSITFLGTGPDSGIPRKGCVDDVCISARRGGKSRRMRSSALVSSGRVKILIDAGPDILEQLKRAKVRRLDAALLTHGHADACSGLRDLDKWAAAHLPNGLFIMTDKVTRARLEKRFKDLCALRFVTIRSYAKIKIGNASIIPFSVKHSVTPGFPALGYLFGKQLAYASDAVGIPPCSSVLLRNIRTLALDGAKFGGKSMAMHFSSHESIRMASKLHAHHLVLTQLGHTYPPHERAEREIRKFLKTSKLKYPKRISLAYDGLTILH